MLDTWRRLPVNLMAGLVAALLLLLGGASLAAEPALAQRGLIEPSKVYFSQDSIKEEFRDPGKPTPDELAVLLKAGKVKASSIPAVHIFWYQPWSRWVSLDNRRLYSFRKAGVRMPYEKAGKAEIERSLQSENGKLSSKNRGESIRVRGSR